MLLSPKDVMEGGDSPEKSVALAVGSGGQD